MYQRRDEEAFAHSASNLIVVPRSVGAFALALVMACAPREANVTPAASPSALSAPAIETSSTTAPSGGGLTVRVSGDRVDVGKSPTFVTNSGELTSDPENEQIVGAIFDYLTRRPEVTKLRVEVHSDGTGADAYNMRMSQARADFLVGVLIDRGVAAGRLHPVGYGKTRPIDTNSTAEGRARNRRVELHVEELSGTPIGNRTAPP